MSGREPRGRIILHGPTCGSRHSAWFWSTICFDPSRSTAELQQFAGIFPNANYSVSYNLLTQSHTPNRR